MKGLIGVALATAIFSACGARRADDSTAVIVPTRDISRNVPPEVKDPNFILTVTEVVVNTDNEGASYTRVFVDGREAGKTAVGRKSEVRTLKLKLPIGNQPVRLEQWVLPRVGEWTRLDDNLQPRERFVRIEDGTIARLELRFGEGGSSNTLTLSRESAPR